MIDVDEEIAKAQRLRECDVCSLDSDPKGGVEVRAKWHCARCWVKLMQRKGLK
jgi:uncharacterized paraquat-inducible protein A